MSNRDLAIQLINQMPDYKLGYAIAYLQGLCVDEVTETEKIANDPNRKHYNSFNDIKKEIFAE
ncbi:MAG: hypothetical protein ACI4G0_02735 [Ruminococcus sp.]